MLSKLDSKTEDYEESSTMYEAKDASLASKITENISRKVKSVGFKSGKEKLSDEVNEVNFDSKKLVYEKSKLRTEGYLSVMLERVNKSTNLFMRKQLFLSMLATAVCTMYCIMNLPDVNI